MREKHQKTRVLVAALVGLAFALPAHAGTVGYWRVEDGTAGNDIVSTADSSGNGYAATQWGSNHDNAKYSSNVGGAYVYDPVADTYSANTRSMLAAGSASTNNCMLLVDNKSAMSGSYTLEMFLKIEDGAGGAANFTASTANRLFQLDGATLGANGTVGASSGASTYLKFSYSGTSYFGSNFEDGNWHHLAYVADYNGVDTTDFSLYVDGAAVITGTKAGRFTAESWRDFRFGLANSTMSDMDWFVDEVRLSDTALTSGQFLQLTSVPEPASIALVGVFGAGFLAIRRLMM